MKKTFTLCLGMVLAAAGTMANADSDVPVYQWGANLSTDQASGTQCNGLACDATGVYYIGGEGSPQAGGPLYFNDDVIGTGSKTDSNSANANLVVVKTDNNGNKLWSLTSSHGDISNNEGGVVVLNDGTVVAVVKIRAASGYLTDGVEFIDGAGKSYKLSDWNNASEPVRSYRVLVMRLAASTGAIKSIKQIVTDITPVANPGGSFTLGTADGMLVNTVTTDGVNIYLGGKYRKAMTIAKASGDKVVLTPHSLESWNGDTQVANGNIYVLKLDGEGNYVTSFLSESPVTLANATSLTYADSNLYMVATVTGMAPDYPEVAFGSVKLTPSQAQSPIVACMDADLNVKWANLYPGTYVSNSSRTFVLQNTGVMLNGNDLWVTGQFNGKLSVPGTDVTVSSQLDNTPREGLLLHLDAATGAWIGGVASSDSYGIKVPGTTVNCITGYFEPFMLPGDSRHVYVFGYGMNANVGTFVRRYDISTLKSDPDTDAWNLVTGGGAPSCQKMTYNPTTSSFICSTRGNREFNIFGSDLKIAPRNNVFGVVMTSFQMPYAQTTGIDAVEVADENTVTVAGGYGMLTVTSDTDMDIEVYDLCGRVAAVANVRGGSAVVAMPAGLYITRYGKVIIR